MEKVNFPKSTFLFKLIRPYLTIQKNEKMYYYDYYIIRQIVEASNPPESISTYQLKEREVKVVRSNYISKTEEFLGLYRTMGFINTRGDTALHKFLVEDFFSKCDQICSFLRIWSHLLKKSLVENFNFCAVKRLRGVL